LVLALLQSRLRRSAVAGARSSCGRNSAPDVPLVDGFAGAGPSGVLAGDGVSFPESHEASAATATPEVAMNFLREYMTGSSP
jgi:hypothetical protein